MSQCICYYFLVNLFKQFSKHRDGINILNTKHVFWIYFKEILKWMQLQLTCATVLREVLEKLSNFYCVREYSLIFNLSSFLQCLLHLLFS